MQEISTILQNGTIVQNRYVVESLLGKGGFGAVYLVRDLRVRGNLFALKEAVALGRSDRERFIFEGEVLKRLDHSALPRVYRTFENDIQTRAYILMDYIEGPNLEILRQSQPDKRFSLAQVLAMLAPIADAVAYLHSQQPPIIHRDIKPANIIVSPVLNESVLVDFGIAKEQEPDSTTTVIRHASPGYAAPEQYSRGTSTRTDVYGLAATVYTLLTGTVPADALFRMTEMGSLGTDPLVPVNSLNPAIPQGVADVLQRALSINSNERYPSVEDFWQALKANQGASSLSDVADPIPLFPQEGILPPITGRQNGSMTPAPRVEVQKLPREGRKRGLLPLFLALIALLVIASAAALFWTFVVGNRPSAPVAPSPVAHHTPITTPTATPTPKPTPSPTPTPKPTPTAKPTPTPTPVPSGYPVLASSYGGTIHNVPANINGNMTLTSIQQNGSAISGYMALSSGLQGNGSFNGTVGKNGSITFLVNAYSNHLPLYFYGTVYRNGSMSGSYCSWQNNQCDYAGGGYGTWTVSPTSASISSFSSLALNNSGVVEARSSVYTSNV